MLDATEGPGTVSLLKVSDRGRALTCAYLGREYTVALDLDAGRPYFHSGVAFESIAHPATETAVALIDLLDALDGDELQAAIDDLDDDNSRDWTGRAHVLNLAPFCEAA